METKIEIPISKAKIVILLIFAILFVLFGALFVISPDLFSGKLTQPLLRIVGVVAVAFFGLCLVFIVKKLFDPNAGMIIDDRGIWDNSSGSSVGLIEWADITGIVTSQVSATRLLMIMTDQPDKYINKAKNRVSEKALIMNHKMFGTPISITSSALQISFDDLERLIMKEWKKRVQ